MCKCERVRNIRPRHQTLNPYPQTDKLFMRGGRRGIYEREG